MDAKNIEKLVQKAKDDILKEVNDRLPRKVGVIAVNHFKQNFRDGGWLDAGLHPWKKTKRQQQKGTDAKYGPLTSRRNHLMSSIQSKPGVGEVSIENPVPYASIHNDGGNITTHPTVSPKMKRFAWHMAYSLAGIKAKDLYLKSCHSRHSSGETLHSPRKQKSPSMLTFRNASSWETLKSFKPKSIKSFKNLFRK